MRALTQSFAERHRCAFFNALGSGIDGTVLRTNRDTAVKFFTDRARFDRELKVYQVLTELGITSVAGHAVPIFVRWDEELLAVEMSIVQPPFLLDFAGAIPEHEAPDFDELVREDHIERLKEKFDDRWQDALAVADAFARATGYVLLDLHPGNIRFV